MATEAQINAIVGLYVAYFDRAPDPAGLQFWIDQLDNGRDFTTISQDFADSAEAQAIYPYLSDDNDLGTISPVAFITNIYANLFGRVPDQAGLEFWTEVLESGAVAPGDMVEAISLGAKDNLNDNGFFDRSVLDNKIECARYFTDQAGEIGTFPQGDQPGQFEIGSPEYLAAVGAVGAAGNQMDNFEECQDFIDTLLREFIPNSSFTLRPVKIFVPDEAEIEYVTKTVLYWGFADTDGSGDSYPGDDEPDNDDEFITAAGIPADAFFGPGGYLETITSQDFFELDVIDTDMDQFSIIDWSSVTNVTITANIANEDGDGSSDIDTGTGGDVGVLTVTYPDGSTDDIALGQAYFDFLCKLILDENGNSRFYEREMIVGQPVYLDASGEFTVVPQPGQEPVGTIEGGVIVNEGEGSYIVDPSASIILTPTENNGGTFESGFTSDDNDFIQVGEVTLLHGAIIDGGGGYNTLEIDAKGHFAQPKALNNIQQITVENLPNVYTIGEDNSSQYPDVVNLLEVLRDAIATAIGEGTDPDDINLLELLEGIDLTDVGGLEGLGALLQAFLGLPDTDTVIDLSRATDLENLTVTEGSYLWLDSAITAFPFLTSLLGQLNGNAGGLNLVGMRNDATLTLQGDFALPLFVQTGAGFSGDGFTVILENVNSDVGNGGMYIFQNAPKLNLVSEGGGNYIRNLNENEGAGINGHVTDLEISGSAHLFIESNLNNIFENDTPATIDASENTGGVDLNISGLEHVTFVGSQGNDRFSALTRNDSDTSQGPDYIPDSEITITNAVGDNYYDVEAKKLTLTDGDGNIELEADTSGATVVLGNGDNIIAIDTAELSLNVGDGDNIIDVEMEDPTFDDDDQAQVLENKNQFEKRVEIVAGEGANKICVEVEGNDNDGSGDGEDTFDYLLDDAVVSITAGDGGNTIEVIQDSDAFTLTDVDINTGSGSDTIRVEASDITINSGGGNDDITLVGIDNDFVFDEVDTEGENGGSSNDDDALINSGNEYRSILSETLQDGVLLNIDTGTGSADIRLGADGEDGDGFANKNLIAKDGSVITGEDITLHVNTYANLIAADLTGITSVILDDDAGLRTDAPLANSPYAGDRAQLTLTVDQFLEIGAENFTVDGATFNTHAFIKLIVDEDTNLSDLNLDALQRNIDLYIEINDGAEVTMTAEQLHTKIARDGVTIAEDGNTDYGMGSVVVTGGGLDFDPFNTNDVVQSIIAGNTYYGGSLSQDFMVGGSWFNVQVKSVFGGYDRPADVVAEVYFTIDADITSEVGALDTWHSNVEIVGNQDITFTGAMELGLLQGANNNLFTVDFSSLEGNANGLTLGNFEMVEAVYGNSSIGYETEVFVEIAANKDDEPSDPGAQQFAGEGSGDESVGFDDDDDGDSTNDGSKVDDRALISQGVQKYTVTVIDGGVMMPDESVATIRLCDETEDLETIALYGNWNDVLEILDAAHGLNFELQGGGTLKREGPTHTSNVGKLVASFKWDHADTTVDIIHANEGDDRPIDAEGIVINNADSITVNAEGPAVNLGMLMGDSLNSVDLNAEGDLTIEGKFDVNGSDSVDLIDASDVVGVFTAAVDGEYVAADDTATPQVEASGGGDFTFLGGAGGSVLTLCNVDDDEAEGVIIDGGAGGVALIIDGDGTKVDLDESTLINVTSVTLENGASIQLTMDQVDAIGSGNFFVEDGGMASMMIKGLSDQPFALANFPDLPPTLTIMLMLADDPKVELNAATDLTGIGGLMVPEGTTLCLTMAQFQQLDGIGSITGDGNVVITDATQADVGANGTDLDLDDLDVTGTVSVILAEDLDLSEADIVDGDPVVDTFEVGDGLTLILGDVTDADGVDVNGGVDSTLQFTDTTGFLVNIDASGFDVDILRITDLLVSGNNVDYIFAGLIERVTKVIYNDDGKVAGRLQNVVIEEGTTIFDDISFNEYQLETEVSVLTVNMEGGVLIDGDLVISTVEVNIEDDNLVPMYLMELNINSTGTGTNNVTGDAENIITGDITPLAYGPAIFFGSRDNNLKTVNINADQDLIIEGKIIFNSHGTDDANAPADGVSANDDDEATGTLNVTGSADVVIDDIDTGDDDVDFLVVNNNGTGDLTIGISSLATVDAGDMITLNGSAVGTDTVVVEGVRDFSGDVINPDWDVIQFKNADDGGGATTPTLGNGNVIVTVTQQQFLDIGPAGFVANGDDSNVLGNNDATLNIVAFDGSVAFDATGLDGDINIGTITMLPGSQTINPATNLTGVGQICVPEGGELTLSAAQYQQLLGTGGLKIKVVDGGDTNGTIDAPITVNITGLTQADIDGGSFDLSMILTDAADDAAADPIGNVTVTLAESVELSDDDVVQTADGADVNTDLESNVEFILSDGQDLGIPLFSQADGLEVTGSGTTDVFFRFDDEDGTAVGFGTQLNASGYDVTNLHALNIFVGGRNVEFLLDDLASSVTLVIYHDPEDLGFLNQTNRVVVVEPGVTVPGVGGTALGFNDLDPDDEVMSVTMTLLGGAILDGDVRFGNAASNPDLIPTFFQQFTLISEGDGVTENLISGGTNNILKGDVTAVSAGPFPDNNLLNVDIIATQELEITGTIIFNGLTGDDDAAFLTVSGTAPITIKALDTTDTDIDSLTITNNGTGVLTITGGSDALELDDTGTLTLAGTGDIVLDTDDGVGNNGIEGDMLTAIDASGLTGNLTAGVLEDVADDAFNFTSGTGVTTMTVAAGTLDSTGTLAMDPSDDTAGWTFDYSAAAVGSKLTIEGMAQPVVGSTLVIEMGPNGVLCINQDLNLSDLILTLNSAQPIVLADGASLTLTAAQADGLVIVGENGADSTGVVNIVDLGDDPVDLSGISADIAGGVYLEGDDVTLDPATDLGSMTVKLVVNDDSDLNPSGGQTIRLSTEAQADGTAIDTIKSFVDDGVSPVTEVDWVLADDMSGNDYFNSSNVAWLFNSISGPLDTSNYDSFLGRLWYSNDLLNSVGGAVEQLFNTLPLTIQRVDFNTVVELDILLASAAVDRVVELTSFTDIVGLVEIDDGPDPEEHIATLTVEFGGEVTSGDFVIGDVVAAPDTDPLTPDFTTLTLNSRVALSDTHFLATEDYVNDNDGDDEEGETVPPMPINTIGDIMVGGTNPLIELMDVEIDTFTDQSALVGNGGTPETNDAAGAEFVFGTLVHSSAGDDVDALLTVTGENDVTGKAVDVSDADIVSDTIDTTGHTGTFLLTGGSPAFIGGDDTGDGNTEELVFDNGGVAAGEILFGHVFDENFDADPLTPGIEGGFVINTDGVDPYAGIDASTLSQISTFQHGGEINLGIVADIDSEDFRISNDVDGGGGDNAAGNGAGVGTVTLCLGEALDADGILVSPELSSTGRWEFDNGTGATGVMNLELKAVTFNAGGQLELDGVDVVVTGDIDLTALDPADISISGGSISVAAGGKLTLTVEQVDALTGIAITGGGTICVVGESDDSVGTTDTDFAFLQTATVDLSAVTLAATDDGVLQVTASGATDDAGDPTTQTIIGSANDDAVTIAGSADDGDAGTVDVITRLGADGGDIGEPNSTPTANTPVDGTPEVLGDIIIGGTANVQVEADAGFDTLTGLKTGDVVQVAAGAEFYATTTEDFVGTADTSNNGTAVIEATVGSTTIDVSDAMGTEGWSLIGPSDELEGAAKIQIIADDVDDDDEEFTLSFSTSTTSGSYLGTSLDSLIGGGGDVDASNASAIAAAVASDINSGFFGNVTAFAEGDMLFLVADDGLPLTVTGTFTASGGTSTTLGSTLVRDTSSVEGSTLIGSDQADNNTIVDGTASSSINVEQEDILTGNALGDRFLFNIATSDPADFSTETTIREARDYEGLEITYADATGDDDATDQITINLDLDGSNIDVLINESLVPGVDFSISASIAAAVVTRLNDTPGITAQLDPADGTGRTVVAYGENGQLLTFNSFVPAATGGGPVMTGDGVNQIGGSVTNQDRDDAGDHGDDGVDMLNDDIGEVSMTLTGAVTVGETYSMTITVGDGDSYTRSVTATTTDPQDVLNSLATQFNAIGGVEFDAYTDTVTPGGIPAVAPTGAVAAGEIRIVDQLAQDGGSNISATAATSAVTALSGSSILDGTETSAADAAADTITDFITGEDAIDFDALGAGTALNYTEGPEAASFMAAVTAANDAANLGGGRTYYLTSTAADGGLLFYDANGDSEADGVIVLTGVDASTFEFTDIV